MDLAALDIDFAMVGPLLIMMLCLGAVMWIAMLGTSLKFSISIFVDDGPSYLACLASAIVLIIINVAIVAGVHYFVGPQPWYIISGYQAMMQMLLVMLLARCNPFKAFLAAFTHGVISTFGTIVLVIGFAIAFASALSGAAERKSEVAAQTAPTGPVEQVNPFFK